MLLFLYLSRSECHCQCYFCFARKIHRCSKLHPIKASHISWLLVCNCSQPRLCYLYKTYFRMHVAHKKLCESSEQLYMPKIFNTITKLDDFCQTSFGSPSVHIVGGWAVFSRKLIPWYIKHYSSSECLSWIICLAPLYYYYLTLDMFSCFTFLAFFIVRLFESIVFRDKHEQMKKQLDSLSAQVNWIVLNAGEKMWGYEHG